MDSASVYGTEYVGSIPTGGTMQDYVTASVALAEPDVDNNIVICYDGKYYLVNEDDVLPKE